MPATGLILESYRFKDLSHERIFGSAPSGIEIKPLGRDISGIPVVFQGSVNSCVSCSVTWVRQWMEKAAERTFSRLSWPFLAFESNTGANGAAPSQVLEPARKIGICPWDDFPADTAKSVLDATAFRIQGYSFITDYSRTGIYAALKKTPIAIGIVNYLGHGPHFMVAYDVTADGQRLLCANWWTDGAQATAEVPFEDVEVAVSFAPIGSLVSSKTHAIDPFKVLIDKIVSFFKYEN